MMYGWYDGNWGIGAWILMAVVMVLFWGGLAAVVLFILRRPVTAHGSAWLRPAHHDAEKVLSERFARGEIDEDEFTARRAALRRA